MAGPISFRYFRSVAGKAVPRYGSGNQARADALIGAERIHTTKAQRQAGEASIVWHDTIVPLPTSWCQRYSKELRGHLKRGELVEVSETDYLAASRADTEPAPELQREADPVKEPDE